MLSTCDPSQYLLHVFLLQDVVLTYMPIDMPARSWSRLRRTARTIRLGQGIEAVFDDNRLCCGTKADSFDSSRNGTDCCRSKNNTVSVSTDSCMPASPARFGKVVPCSARKPAQRSWQARSSLARGCNLDQATPVRRMVILFASQGTRAPAPLAVSDRRA